MSTKNVNTSLIEKELLQSNSQVLQKDKQIRGTFGHGNREHDISKNFQQKTLGNYERATMG